jgi:lipopolysaccharide heptosyltransferase III
VNQALLDPPAGFWARLLAKLSRVLLPLPDGVPRSPRSVLVVRTDDRVGNALLTIPLVRALQKALPEAKVDLLLAARRAQVAEGLPGLDVVRFDKRDAFAHPIRFVKFLVFLRARYEVVFDAAHWHAFSLTSALLSRWAAARAVVGHSRGGCDFLYQAVVQPPPDGTREVEAKLRLGFALGLALESPPEETALGRSKPNWKGRYAAINPGARKPDHRWPKERFAALARGLRERQGLSSVVFWGPGEEDLAREVAKACGAELAPATDLEQLAAAFRNAALVITNDTGPMHLAAACGAPVLALFLDEAGLRWAHEGPRFSALVAPDDAQALAAAERLLDSAAPAAQPARSLEEPP